MQHFNPNTVAVKKSQAEVTNILKDIPSEQISAWLRVCTQRNRVAPHNADNDIMNMLDHLVTTRALTPGDIYAYHTDKSKKTNAASCVDVSPIADMYTKTTLEQKLANAVLTFTVPKDNEVMAKVEVPVHTRVFTLPAELPVPKLPRKAAWTEIITRISEGVHVSNGRASHIQTQDLKSKTLQPYYNPKQYDGFIITLNYLNENMVIDNTEESQGKKSALNNGMFPPKSPVYGNELRSLLYRHLHKFDPNIFSEAMTTYESLAGTKVRAALATAERVDRETVFINEGREQRSTMSLPKGLMPLSTSVANVSESQASQYISTTSSVLGSNKTGNGTLALESVLGVPLPRQRMKEMANTLDLQVILPCIRSDAISYATPITDEAYSCYRQWKEIVGGEAPLFVHMIGTAMVKSATTAVRQTGGVLTGPLVRKDIPAIYLGKVSFGAGSSLSATHENAKTKAMTDFEIHRMSGASTWFCRHIPAYAEVLRDNAERYSYTVVNSAWGGRGQFLYRVLDKLYRSVFPLYTQTLKASKANKAYIKLDVKTADQREQVNLLHETVEHLADIFNLGMTDMLGKFNYLTDDLPYTIPYANLNATAHYCITHASTYGKSRQTWNQAVTSINEILQTMQFPPDSGLYGLVFHQVPTKASRFYPTKQEADLMEDAGLPAFLSRAVIDLTPDDIEAINAMEHVAPRAAPVVGPPLPPRPQAAQQAPQDNGIDNVALDIEDDP